MADVLIEGILRFLDRLAPRPPVETPEARRQARAIVGATLIGCVIVGGTAFTTLLLRFDPLLIPVNLAWPVVAAGLLVVARRAGSPRLLANGLLALAFVYLLVLSAIAGGRNVGALFGFSVFPMLAVLLAGWRSGLVFTGLAAAAVILTPLVPLTPSAPDEVAAVPASGVLVRDALNVILAVGLIATLYDVLRNATLRDAEASRARAENAADRQRQLLELSERLHNATGEQFESVLNRAMEQTARLAGADRTHLQLVTATGLAGRFTWGQASAPHGSVLADIEDAKRTFSWTAERVFHGAIVRVARLEELPDEAREERDYLESRGVASWLCVPIRAAGRTIGYQGFETIEQTKQWDDEEVAALQLMSELLGSAVVRHRIQEALKESEKKFAIAFRDHPDAMFIMDLETRQILECNEQWLREAGRERREDVVGRPPWGFDFEVPQEQVAEMIRIVESRGELPAVELSLVGRGGEFRTYLVSARKIVLDGRDCALTNIHDLTTHKELEQQLVHAQKMEAVGRLAGGVAHDYNNMLTVISGYSAGLMDALEGDLQKDAEEIHEAARRSAEMTRQLLAFSRRQVLQIEPLDPNRLLGGLQAMLRPLIGETIDLQLDLGADVCPVSSDRGQLEQAVVNLVVNGADAMQAGGTLRLETRLVEIPRGGGPVGTSDLVRGSYVAIAVVDEGEGMDPDVLARVMEPFYTTKPEGRGTGLGLPMVHGLARQCGGTLTLESERGHGTRAALYLPVSEEELETQEGSASPDEKSEAASRVRVLLVEDEARVRRLAARALRQRGYEVVEVEDGEQALEHAVALGGGGFDVLVTDVVMPHLSGPDVVCALRQTRPELPVVLMSGYPDAEGRPIPDDVVFLAKPFEPDALLEAVVRALPAKSESIAST